MRIYTLLSTPAIHAPGIVRICLDLWRSRDLEERIRGLKFLAEFRGLPTRVAIRLLEGEQTFEIVGDTVKIVTDEPDDPPRLAVHRLWVLLDSLPDCLCKDTLPGCTCMTCRVRNILEETGNKREIADESIKGST